MYTLLTNKIATYTSEIASALDDNDYISALKLRAAQKELEDVLLVVQPLFPPPPDNVTLDVFSHTDFYTVKQVSEILDVHPANITRKATQFSGIKKGHKWFFPKNVIDSIRSTNLLNNKPGPKTQKSSSISMNDQHSEV